MFFVVALTNGVLTSRLKTQKNLLGEKEKRASALYLLLKEMASADSPELICSILVNNIYKVFGVKSVIYFPENEVKLNREAHPDSTFQPDEMEWLAAESALKEKCESGKFTGIVNNADAVYFPLISDNNVLCIIGVKTEGDSKDEKLREYLRLFINEAVPFFRKYIETQEGINHSIP
jgi:two-component system sensor histidine kinase KdpD